MSTTGVDPTDTPDDAPVLVLLDAANRAPSPSAVHLWRRALELIDPADPLHAAVESNLARSLMASGRNEEATALANQVGARTTDPAVLVRSRVTAAFASMAAEGASDLLEPLDPRELEAIRATVDRPSLRADESSDPAIAVADHALGLLLGGRALAAATEAEVALALGTTTQAQLAARMTLASVALHDGRLGEAWRHTDDLMRELRSSNEEFLLAGYGPWLVEALVELGTGDPGGALDAVAEGNRIAALVSMPMLRAHFAPAEAGALLALGRWAEADARLAEALDVGEAAEYRIFSSWLWATRSLLASWRADASAASVALQAACSTRTAQHSGLQHVLAAEATIARFGGDAERELAVYRQLDADLTSRGIRTGWWPALVAHIRAEMGDAGDPQLGRALVGRLPAPDPDLPMPGVIHRAGRSLAAADPAGLTDAADALAPVAVLEAAELRVDAARILHRRGEKTEAARQAHLAWLTYRALGAHAYRAELEDWLAREHLTLPTTRRQRPGGGGSASLTPAERRVAALVCQGLTNAQAAERLGVSPRTIETHLHRVFAKLGVTSRARLIASSPELGLPDAD